MTDDQNMRDVNPQTEGLPGKGRTVIALIAGGIVLIVLMILSRYVRPIGLLIGGITFGYGIQMLFRRNKFNLRTGLIVTICGFLLLLANPRFGVVTGFASTLLVIAALLMIVFGLINAIKLAWDLGRFS